MMASIAVDPPTMRTSPAVSSGSRERGAHSGRELRYGTFYLARRAVEEAYLCGARRGAPPLSGAFRRLRMELSPRYTQRRGGGSRFRDLIAGTIRWLLRDLWKG
eukprot:scaffold13204_cov133-Isochrysis_galbana.AAC.2